MSVLVDTSIWVEYFRNGNNAKQLDLLIDENIVVTNRLILAELVPFLKIRNHKKLVNLLYQISRLELIINWEEIVTFQYRCLKNGINGIGIPDLIIAQNAKQNHCRIYSLDHHFTLMKKVIEIELFNS